MSNYSASPFLPYSECRIATHSPAKFWRSIMMRPFSAVRMIVILGVITALSAGCSRDPNVRKQRFFKSGQEYFEQGKYREAALQFENATQVDPRFAEAHYSLAQTFLR